MTPELKRLLFPKLWFWNLNRAIKAPWRTGTSAFRALKGWWFK